LGPLTLDQQLAFKQTIMRYDLHCQLLEDFNRMHTDEKLSTELEYAQEIQHSIDKFKKDIDRWLKKTGLDREKGFNVTELIYWNPERPQDLWGTYSSFDGSPASMGWFHFDLSNHEPSGLFDWDTLKKDTQCWGWRNSLTTAYMPTASTAQIMGNNECFEPITSNVYSRSVLSGNFMIVNKYLQKDLMKLGFWKRDLIDEIIRARGSVQNILKIPKELRDLYKTSWELSKKTYLKMARDRGCFIDQSQSLNLFIEEPTPDLLTTVHLYGWELGLKTGMYYLRRKTVANAQQFSVEASKVGGGTGGSLNNKAPLCQLDPDSCVTCSA